MKKLLVILTLSLFPMLSLSSTVPPNPELIYKIYTQAEWAQREGKTAISGNALDLQSGYIHLSQLHQVTHIARKYFGQEPQVILVGIKYDACRDFVKWEPNSKGELFPHLYAELDPAWIASIKQLAPPTEAEPSASPRQASCAAQEGRPLVI